MPEPIVERLSRFTPDGSRLDRDALLFAAGRASVRPMATAWSAAVGALIACQLVTLVLLWPQAKTPFTPTDNPPRIVELRAVDVAPIPADSSAIWTLSQSALRSETCDLPRGIAVDKLVAADPPLRASGTASQLILD
jgi:hypothetical protein